MSLKIDLLLLLYIFCYKLRFCVVYVSCILLVCGAHSPGCDKVRETHTEMDIKRAEECVRETERRTENE